MASLFDSPLFETLLSLTLMFAILSLLASSILEMINSYFNERGKQLYAVLSRLFDDNINVNFGQMLYTHPMILGIRKDKESYPQFISDAMFSQVIIELIANYSRDFRYDENKREIVLASGATVLSESDTLTGEKKDLFSMFRAGVTMMEHTSLRMMLINMADKSEAIAANGTTTPIACLENQIKQWYNDQSDRMTGWFKDSIKKKLRIIAFFVAIVLNVDAIHVFQTVYMNPDLRSEISNLSEHVADNYSKVQHDSPALTETEKEIKALQLSNIVSATRDTSQLALAKNILSKLQHLDSLSKADDSLRAINYQSAYERIDELESLGLPIGWKQDSPPLCWFSKSIAEDSSKTDRISTHFMGHRKSKPANWLLYALGIFITTMAVSMGAPFWFEVLLKFVNIRRAGKKPEKTTTE